MHGLAGLPVDIVLLAMIAGFLALRLRSILGRRPGADAPPPLRDRAPPPAPVDRIAGPGPIRAIPDPASALGSTLAAIRQQDRSFDPVRFLTGAENAFRQIVAAYVEGNRDALRPLLTDEAFAAFDQAITARAEAGETLRTEIREIEESAIAGATLGRAQADITVRFRSRQINLTLGRNGQPVAGTDAVTEITDLWTFARDLASPDTPWRLAAARSG